MEFDVIAAHKFSSNYKPELENDKLCGCFYCMKIYSPAEIAAWINDRYGKTAVCPHCGIDSVLPGNRVTLSKDYLEKMHKVWF